MTEESMNWMLSKPSFKKLMGMTTDILRVHLTKKIVYLLKNRSQKCLRRSLARSKCAPLSKSSLRSARNAKRSKLLRAIIAASAKGASHVWTITAHGLATVWGTQTISFFGIFYFGRLLGASRQEFP